MIKKFIVILFIVCYAFGGNCQQLSLEMEQKIENFLSKEFEKVSILNGLECDNGLYYKTYIQKEIIFGTVCNAIYFENLSGIVVFEMLYASNEIYFQKLDMNMIGSVKYDEYLNEIEKSEVVETKKNCIDLYNEFKRKINE